MPVIVCSISAFFAFSAAFRSATSRPCSSRTCTPHVSTGRQYQLHLILLQLGIALECNKNFRMVPYGSGEQIQMRSVGRPLSACMAILA